MINSKNACRTLTLPGHFAHSAQFQPGHTKTAGHTLSPMGILEKKLCDLLHRKNIPKTSSYDVIVLVSIIMRSSKVVKI